MDMPRLPLRYLRRAVQNCRRAILGETPRNLIGTDERIL
jgi:hypothetical protein